MMIQTPATTFAAVSVRNTGPSAPKKRVIRNVAFARRSCSSRIGGAPSLYEAVSIWALTACIGNGSKAVMSAMGGKRTLGCEEARNVAGRDAKEICYLFDCNVRSFFAEVFDGINKSGREAV